VGQEAVTGADITLQWTGPATASGAKAQHKVYMQVKRVYPDFYTYVTALAKYNPQEADALWKERARWEKAVWWFDVIYKVHGGANNGKYQAAQLVNAAVSQARRCSSSANGRRDR
jgi:hypothetical protein